MQTVIDNDYASLKVYPDKKIVHHEFKKFFFGDNFKNFMMDAADVFIKHACNKWLSDDRGNSAIRQEDLQWAQENWEPKILKAGWKYWAIIMPEKAIGQMNMKKIIERYKQKGIIVNAFSSTEAALSWLEAQN